MIQVAEQGRRLRITVGEGEDPENPVFLIPPQDTQGGATLLSAFLGIMGDPLGASDGLEVDLIRASCGAPILRTGVEPTEAQIARMAEADEVFLRLNDLRQEEMQEVTTAALFWQTAGGLPAAQAYAEGGEDAYPKALNLLLDRSGLATFVALTSTGNSPRSNAAPSPTDDPATSTPSSSDGSFKVPPGAKRPQDRKPKQTTSP